MKLTVVFFIILFLSCFFEATNPLDSAYQGSYNFESTDTLPSQLEVLKEYRIKFENNGTDKYWKFYCSFDSSATSSVVRIDSSRAYSDSGYVSFVFKKEYKGKITFVAEQPNRTKVEMPLHKQNTYIQVLNPFTIDGPRLVGIRDSAFLRVLYKGEPIKSGGSDSVIIDDKNTKPLSESISVTSSSITTTLFNIKIKRNNDTLYDTFYFPAFTISFPGYSPRISQFIRNDSSSLRLGGPASFSVMLKNGGGYSGKHIYKLTSGTSVLSIDTLNYDSNTIQVLTIDTLKDTLYSKIMLTVYNNDSLTDTMSHTAINVYPAKPVLNFRDSSTAVDQDSTFKVDVAINESFGKDSFYWKYQGVKDSVTTTPFITVPPVRGVSDTISVYAKRVYNFGGKSFEYRSDTLTKVFHPIEFKYKIDMKSIEKKQIVAKSIDTFQVCVTTGGAPVPDDSLVYSWIFPPSIDTNFVKIIPKKPIGSGFILTVMDSVKLPKFYFSVQAKLRNGTDSTALWKSKDIIVRNYRPSLTLTQPLTATSLMQDIAFDVSDSNDVVSMVYYKFSDTIVSDDKSVKTAAPQSKKFILYFKRNGTATVKAWAVDASGFVSDTQTVKFKVEVVTPQFPIKPDTVEATIGVAKTLHARLASPLDRITYIWDRNGNGEYNDDIIDTTTMYSDSINFIPLDATPDTLFVQCINKDGVWAPNPYTLIVVAKKNEPVIDTLQVDSAARYGNDNMTIKSIVSDRDSNLTNVKIYWSFNGGADTLLCDSMVKAPFKTCTIDAVKKNNRYGTYKFTVIASDSRGNTSTSFINHTLLKGDPVVDSVKVTSESPYYLKKTVQVTVYARDPNAGTIDSVQFIKSNDSLVITTKKWLNPNAYTFTTNDLILNDTGLQYIRVRVIDNEGNRSAIKPTSSQIRVLPHTPRIDTMIRPSTPAYLNKDIPDSIIVFDPCSAAYTTDLSYSVSYNDTLNFGTPQTSPKVKLKFATEGLNRFYIKVTDAENFSTIRADSITILKGEPVFISGIDQTVSYWTKDEQTFKFRCYDPNGTVDKIRINWGDGTALDSITTRSNVNDTFTFEKNKRFTNIIKKDSTYRINLTLIDNDGKTTNAIDSIIIKQGKPTLRPSFGNDSTTIFGKYDPSNAELPCTLSVLAEDIHGKILKYYWFLSKDSSSLESANYNDTISKYVLRYIPTNLANTIYTTVTVIVMDDDSNLVAKKFNVYVDAPPPVPTIIRPNSGSTVFGANDTIYFEWHGLDKLDSMATYFEISISPAGTLNWTTIVPFSLASSPDFSVTDVNGVKHFTYKYRPVGLPLPSTYSYIWRIRSQDRCNSITTNESGSFSHN
jgi:hypothetical protein